MKQNKTDITLIVDCSGSMAPLVNDTYGAIRNFVEEQRKIPGECTFSITKFGSIVIPLFTNQNIHNVSIDNQFGADLGSTALLDAIGMTVDNVGNRLQYTPEYDRPGRVLIAIITDGEENSSRTFNIHRVREMTQHQESKYSWKFAFLAANIDSVKVGTNYGISINNIQSYNHNAGGIYASMSNLTNSVSAYRCCTRNSYDLSAASVATPDVTIHTNTK